jgi:signal transduction histidine kinase
VIPDLVVVGGWAFVDDPSVWSRIERAWAGAGVIPLIVALAAIAWAMDPPGDRMSRRRLIWLVTWSVALVAAVVVASTNGGARAAATVSMLCIGGFGGLVFRLVTLRDLRPVDEPLVDVAIAVATVAVTVAAGVVVRVGAVRLGAPGPDLSGAFAAVVVAAMVFPTGLWLRRTVLERRYGNGILPAAHVAQITADLHAYTDARELLGKAAVMIGAASGAIDANLVVGPDAPDVPPHFTQHPLIVGGDRVGTVYYRSRHREGPEPRQQRTVAQLLPTVALVAKAVSLAVESDHARRDVARERDAERTRILSDLHDGIGPVLVGMSLRVRAELRQRPTPLLQALAAELADCRGDLRRIVSGLAPPDLYDGDLDAALQRLVASFAQHGPLVRLRCDIPGQVSPEAAVAIYRSVAEGVTNAVRHAQAHEININVHGDSDSRIVVEIRDDGLGGPVTPGVGLTSLRRRAIELGGDLDLVTTDSGVRLRVQIPTMRTAP